MEEFLISAIDAYLDGLGCSCGDSYYQCSVCAFKQESSDLAEFIIEYKVDKEKG